MSLQDEIALVTGASRGIGKAIALELARHGATVVGTATTPEGADSISEYFRQADLVGYGYPLNVCQPESIDSLLKDITEQYGAVSILVNNAGITRDNLLMRMKESEWDEIIATNLTSVYRLCKACVKSMTKARKGRIINVASIVAASGNPGQTNYASAKAGMIGFSKSLALEIGSRQITVNTVAPGFIDTDMTKYIEGEQRTVLEQRIPLGRLGDVEDIAHMVAFLASPQAGYITGQTIHVNGGLYMS